MKKAYHVKKRNAFTLVEIALAMVLMTFVLFLAGSLLNLGSLSFTGSEVHLTIVREDSAFAAKLNQAIQESTVSFTVPKNSFNDTSKLTAGWNYLGLMEDVHIPKDASRTGEEIASAQALVYIEYWGETAPSSIPSDCNLIHNADGYFIQKILGHAFTDHLGTTHSYTLEFKPTNPNNTAAQTIVYEFSSDVTSHTGEDVGSTFDIGPMLTCLNAIQVVYKGGSINPATALAFRSDFMPTWSAQQASTSKPAATVIMVMDTSGSMAGSRMTQLRTAAKDLINQLATNEKINVIMVPFGWYAGDYNPGRFTFNLGTDLAAAISRINGLRANGNTNLGDGMRVAYHELLKLKNSGSEVGSVFLMMMTDGAMNAYSWYQSGSTKYFYMGASLTRESNSGSSAALRPGYGEVSKFYTYNTSAGARNYAKVWGEKWKSNSDFTLTKTYLISLYNGMSAADRTLLESIFGTETIDVNSLTDFQTVFEDIGSNIEAVIWAFEGPNL